MYLKYKINAVNRVFRQADACVASFQNRSKLSCLPGCSLCCQKKNIEATILEFLPAAYHLYLSGKYHDVLDDIENRLDGLCVFYNPFSNEGSCSLYQNRGLVCRLFGFSKKTDKQDSHILITCRQIKEHYNIDNIRNKLIHAPEISSFYLKLYGIDPKLVVHYSPINEAVKAALEIVLLHFKYTKKPA